MRRYRAALTAATALTLMLVTMVVAGPAQAGGPTSVLMVVPGTGQTASLYTGDARLRGPRRHRGRVLGHRGGRQGRRLGRRRTRSAPESR